MQQDRYKRLYHLHSACGIWFGYFLYFVAVTGCFALFYNETQSWEDPALRITHSAEIANIDQAFAEWLNQKAENGQITFARLDFPTTIKPFYYGNTIILDTNGHTETFEQRWDASSGKALPYRGDGAVDWLYAIHRELSWPESLGGRNVGRALVGIAGIVLLVSIISGILIHTKILKEMFTARFYRSVRLKWQDSHKIIGVWGIPVFAMFGFTGAFLGIIILLTPVTAFLTLKGDQEALVATVIGEQAKPTGVSAAMLPPSAVKALPKPDGVTGDAFMLVYKYWGDQNAELEVSYENNTDLTIGDAYPRNPITGEELPRTGTLDTTNPPVTVLTSYTALHYGTYGGIALKFLYFTMGLALAIMTGLGLVLWIERRLHGNEGQKSKVFYKRVSHATAGALMGVPFASASVLLFDRLYFGIETARYNTLGWVYFALIGFAIFFAFIRRNDYQTTKTLMKLTGGLFLLIPVVNIITTDNTLAALYNGQHSAAGYTDIGLFILGIVTVFTGFKLPKARSDKKDKAKPAHSSTQAKHSPENLAAE
jgi:uncharacterized iron-regulated membrane protein